MKKEKKGYKGIPLSMAFFKFPLKPSTTDLVSSPSPKRNVFQIPCFSLPWTSALQRLWLRSSTRLFSGSFFLHLKKIINFSIYSFKWVFLFLFIYLGFGRSKETQTRGFEIHWLHSFQAPKAYFQRRFYQNQEEKTVVEKRSSLLQMEMGSPSKRRCFHPPPRRSPSQSTSFPRLYFRSGLRNWKP